MPETIGALILSAFAVSASAGFTIAGVTITYASIVGATVLAAAEFAISSALIPSAPKPDGQLSLQQPVPWRRRIYGRAKVGGYFVWWTSLNGNLYSVLALGSQQFDAFEEYWVSDRKVALDGSGFVTSVTAPAGSDPNQFNPSGKKPVRILSNTGGPGKTAYAALTAVFPTLWTAAHIGVGIADVLLIEGGVKSDVFSSVYPGGQQTIRCVIRGAIISDPRTSPASLAWSDNGILVILDYLTNTDGWRVSSDTFLTGQAAAVTLASIAVADEDVPLASGGSEKRYRIWGSYDFNEEPRVVLARMLAACGAWLQPFPDGTIGIQAGRWIAPTFTITDDMILSYEVQHFVSEFDSVNEIRATFTYQQNDYQDTESLPWQDAADIARRGYIKSTTVDARHCPSFTQCRRIQKIAAAEAMPDFSITLTLSIEAIKMRGMKFVNLAMDQLGLAGSFRVTAFSTDLQSQTCSVGLASFTSDAYAWDTSDEGPAPPVPGSSAAVVPVETPTGLLVVVQSGTIGGATGAYLVISCDAPAFRDDLSVKFEIEDASTGQWQTISQGTQNYQTSTGVLPDSTYNVRVSFFAPGTPLLFQSAFDEVDGVVVAASTVAPTAPTGIALDHLSPGVGVSFTAPNSATFVAARVWRNNVSVFSSATDISGALYGAPNQHFAYTDTPSSGTWYYWATAESSTGNRSAPDGPVSITV
jgi:hypothetical protein